MIRPNQTFKMNSKTIIEKNKEGVGIYLKSGVDFFLILFLSMTAGKPHQNLDNSHINQRRYEKHMWDFLPLVDYKNSQLNKTKNRNNIEHVPKQTTLLALFCRCLFCWYLKEVFDFTIISAFELLVTFCYSFSNAGEFVGNVSIECCKKDGVKRQSDVLYHLSELLFAESNVPILWFEILALSV